MEDIGPTRLDLTGHHTSAAQRQTAVTANLKSKQLLLFASAHNTRHFWLFPPFAEMTGHIKLPLTGYDVPEMEAALANK